MSSSMQDAINLCFKNRFKCVQIKIVSACLLLVSVHGTGFAGLMPLTPDTSGQYKSDFQTAWNNTTEFGQLGETKIGGTQGALGNRVYRSYLIFDTQQADALIIGASLKIGITYWTTSQGLTPNPGAQIGIDFGLPALHSPLTIASNHTSPGNIFGQAIFDDLGTRSLGSIIVDSAPNIVGSGPPVVWYTLNLPLSFISAFNQAKLGTDRYIAVGIKVQNERENILKISNNVGEYAPQLIVNSISVVPEPWAIVSLISGLLIMILGRVRSISG